MKKRGSVPLKSLHVEKGSAHSKPPTSLSSQIIELSRLRDLVEWLRRCLIMTLRKTWMLLKQSISRNAYSHSVIRPDMLTSLPWLESQRKINNPFRCRILPQPILTLTLYESPMKNKMSRLVKSLSTLVLCHLRAPYSSARAGLRWTIVHYPSKCTHLRHNYTP